MITKQQGGGYNRCSTGGIDSHNFDYSILWQLVVPLYYCYFYSLWVPTSCIFMWMYWERQCTQGSVVWRTSATHRESLDMFPGIRGAIVSKGKHPPNYCAEFVKARSEYKDAIGSVIGCWWLSQSLLLSLEGEESMDFTLWLWLLISLAMDTILKLLLSGTGHFICINSAMVHSSPLGVWHPYHPGSPTGIRVFEPWTGNKDQMYACAYMWTVRNQIFACVWMCTDKD